MKILEVFVGGWAGRESGLRMSAEGGRQGDVSRQNLDDSLSIEKREEEHSLGWGQAVCVFFFFSTSV